MKNSLMIYSIALTLLLLSGISTIGAEDVVVTNDAHPSLLMSTGDFDKVRSRLEREPYSNWWANATRLANANYVVEKETEFVQLEYARRARHGAFCYLLTGDEAYAGKALRWMKEFPRMMPWVLEILLF